MCTVLSSPKREPTGGFGAGSPVSQEPESHLSKHAIKIEELLRIRDQQHHLMEHHGRFQPGGMLSSPSLPSQAGVQGTNPSLHCACPQYPQILPGVSFGYTADGSPLMSVLTAPRKEFLISQPQGGQVRQFLGLAGVQ